MIDNESEIENWAISNEAWRESARGVLTDDWDIADEVKHRSEELVRAVIRGSVAIDDLRGGVIWANALDEEATFKFGADTTVGDQIFERTARRIMHQAGRMALNQVKNYKKRTTLIIRQKDLVQ